MTQEQVDTIWKLANEIEFRTRPVIRSTIGTEQYRRNVFALIRTKSKLYQYLKENLDDTESL